MSNVYRKSLNKYLELKKHEIQLAESRGKSDAKSAVINKESADFEGYMQDTLSNVKGAWASYESSFSKYEDEIEQKISNEQFQIDNGIPNELNSLEEKKNDSELLFESKEGHASPDYQKIEEDLRLSKEDYEKIRATLNRPLQIKFEKIYIPFLVALALIEVPINRQAFELFFEGSSAVVLGLALAVGVMLVFFAHSVGHLIKENSGHENSDQPKFMTFLGVGSIFLVTSILMYFLAVMRQSYAVVEKGAAETFGSLFSDVPEIDLLTDNLFQPLSSEGVSLLVLNTSIYFAGILASYFRHDPNPNYEKITINYEKLRKKMSLKKERIENALTKIQKDYNAQTQSINIRRNNILQNLENLNTELLQIKDEKNADFKTMVVNVNTILKSYEKGYRSQKSSEIPMFFSNSYQKMIEAELKS